MDIEITIDEETGEISYTISSEDLDQAESLQWSLSTDGVQTEIETTLVDLIPEASVEDITIEEDVVAIVEFSVNADDADAHLMQAADQITNVLEDRYLSFQQMFLLQLILEYPLWYQSYQK